MIRCEQMGLTYGRRQEVLKGVTLHLAPGSFHFLAGASGAGKSSLLALFALAIRPSSGRLWMFGEDVAHCPREVLPFLRRRIGVVYQDFRLLDHLSVAENVALPLKVAGQPMAEIRAKVKELLEWIGLDTYHDAKPETLSGGQQQLVAIARAVINKPELLIADEPSGNLDSALSLKLMYLFQALNKGGTTVLVASHDENLISRFDYPTFRLREGKLL